jgi:hypothetical protein
MEGGKAAPEPPFDLLDDETEPTASELVDFTYYSEVIPAGLERPPRDVEEPRLLTLTNDTARALADKRTQTTYDEYLHIGCYAFFDSCANAAIGEGMDTLSNGPPLSAEQTAAVALIRAGIAPTQRRRRPPVLDWASCASPRAERRAMMRTACSRNCPTSVSVAHARPRSPAHWMRFAKLSSTERLRSAFTLPAKLLPVQPSPRSLQTSQQALTPRPAKLPPTDARPQQRRQ